MGAVVVVVVSNLDGDLVDAGDELVNLDERSPLSKNVPDTTNLVNFHET